MGTLRLIHADDGAGSADRASYERRLRPALPTDAPGPVARIPNGETPKMATWRPGNGSKRSFAETSYIVIVWYQ
jgi:hypothetical protein